MIRYTRGGNRLISDIIGSENSCDLQAGGVRPVWVDVNIPRLPNPACTKEKWWFPQKAALPSVCR